MSNSDLALVAGVHDYSRSDADTPRLKIVGVESSLAVCLCFSGCLHVFESGLGLNLGTRWDTRVLALGTCGW